MVVCYYYKTIYYCCYCTERKLFHGSLGWVVAIAIAIVIVVCIVFLDDGLQLADHQVQGHGVESHGHDDVCVALGRLHEL
jgi:hypothetical protein